MTGKVAAGFVIFRRICDRIEYLLLQTSYGDHHWTPPKGHVDPGENDEMLTALRETWEESGLQEGDLKIFPDLKKVLHYPVKGKPKTVIYWLAELKNPETPVVLSDEHEDFKWLKIEDACTFGKYPEMQEALLFFDEYIKNSYYKNKLKC